MDVWLNLDGLERFAVAFERLSIRPDEKLLKIPANIRSADRAPYDEFGIFHQGRSIVTRNGQLLLQEGKDRVCANTIDITLLEQGEIWLKAPSRTHILQRIEYLFIMTVFLEAKLVTREAQHHEAVGVAALELVKLGEIPGGRASEGSQVLDQDHLASVDVEVQLVPLQGDGAEIVEGLDSLSHRCSEWRERECVFL